MQNSIQIGTRGSPLALWQANWVKSALEKKYPHRKCELQIIKTAGDISQLGDKKLDNKAQFVKEIEDALLSKKVDVAVHSMKDLPGFLPDGLIIAAIPQREDPQDVIISADGIDFSKISKTARIGTSSIRRQCQLKQLRPGFSYLPIRGNVDTRLSKLARGDCDAIVLAKAGLKRLGIDVKWHDLEMIPAVGQGALAIEVRNEDQWVKDMAFLNDTKTAVCVSAERHFLSLMGGNCQTPLACHVREVNFQYEVTAFLSEIDGSKFRKKQLMCESAELIKTVEQIVKELKATSTF